MRLLGRKKPEEDRLARQRREVGPDGWTCHVCGDYRPDEKISVRSSRSALGQGMMQLNVRYCNDRPECIDGSHDVWRGVL